MLTIDNNNRDIQALPIHQETFIGVPTNQECSNKVVHATEDGDITFIFNGDDKVVSAVAGDDFAASKECTGITATITVIIS